MFKGLLCIWGEDILKNLNLFVLIQVTLDLTIRPSIFMKKIYMKNVIFKTNFLLQTRSEPQPNATSIEHNTPSTPFLFVAFVGVRISKNWKFKIKKTSIHYRKITSWANLLKAYRL